MPELVVTEPVFDYRQQLNEALQKLKIPMPQFIDETHEHLDPEGGPPTILHQCEAIYQDRYFKGDRAFSKGEAKNSVCKKLLAFFKDGAVDPVDSSDSDSDHFDSRSDDAIPQSLLNDNVLPPLKESGSLPNSQETEQAHIQSPMIVLDEPPRQVKKDASGNVRPARDQRLGLDVLNGTVAQLSLSDKPSTGANLAQESKPLEPVVTPPALEPLPVDKQTQDAETDLKRPLLVPIFIRARREDSVSVVHEYIQKKGASGVLFKPIEKPLNSMTLHHSHTPSLQNGFVFQCVLDGVSYPPCLPQQSKKDARREAAGAVVEELASRGWIAFLA